MEVDVKAGRFLEHGEYDGNLYGTKMESIHEVVAAGRTCILDVNPQVRGGGDPDWVRAVGRILPQAGLEFRPVRF